MRTLLRTGQTVFLRYSGLPCTVQEFIGGGGQGEVYRATLTSGTSIALKWYSLSYLKKDPGLESRLNELINLDFQLDEFLWPFDLADAPSTPAFGYAMPVCKSHLKSVDLLINDPDQPSFRVLATAAFNLATAFNHLHSDNRIGGRCYRDISSSNVMVDPSTGDIRILDNDNVDIT